MSGQMNPDLAASISGVAGPYLFKSETLATDLDYGRTEWIDNVDSLKISLIIGDNDAAVGLRNGSHDCVQGTPWAARRLSACH